MKRKDKEDDLNHWEKFIEKQGYVRDVIMFVSDRWIKEAWK